MKKDSSSIEPRVVNLTPRGIQAKRAKKPTDGE